MPSTRSTPHVHHRVNPRYILRRQLNIDGRFRLPGEEIPEAATWPNLYSYLDLGWVEVLDEDEEDVPTMGASRPKVVKEPVPVVEEPVVVDQPVVDKSVTVEKPTKPSTTSASKPSTAKETT